jgi:hypothetical protein
MKINPHASDNAAAKSTDPVDFDVLNLPRFDSHCKMILQKNFTNT